MKAITLITAALLVVFFAGCKKPSEQVATLPTEDPIEQTHDGNTFMTILSESMDTDGVNTKEDADRDYAKLMIVHHKSGIEMAKKIQEIGADTTVKHFASNIIAINTREIDQLDSFLTAHKNKVSASGKIFAPITDSIMVAMKIAADKVDMSGSFDYDFTRLMIVHHQTGIDLSTAAAKYVNAQYLRNFTYNNIAAQNRDIKAYNAWIFANKQ